MLTILLLLNFVAAQEKESNHDLRDKKLLFSIEADSKKTELLQSGADYTLVKEEKMRRIAEAKAKSLDQEFGALFLKLQYEMSPAAEACKNNVNLNLRTEKFIFCEKDEQRAQALKLFLEKTNSF